MGLWVFFAFTVLGFNIPQNQGTASQKTPPLILDPATKAQLQQISALVVDRKPDAELFKAWDKFVDKSRRIDYAACIRFVFEDAKAQAEKKARQAEEEIERTNYLKKAIAEERDFVRRLKTALGRGKPFEKIPKKNLTRVGGSSDRFFIKQDGYVSTIKELDEYEGYIDWAGREASLAGTAGVALLEFAKDAIQTAVSNISGVGTQQVQMKKIVERKLGSMG
jgi:hypothetical protein